MAGYPAIFLFPLFAQQINRNSLSGTILLRQNGKCVEFANGKSRIKRLNTGKCGVRLRMCGTHSLSNMIKKRPKHLALHLIKLPLPGIVSILHRLSGTLLFLALPLLLMMLHYSLNSIETHTQLIGVLSHPLARLMLICTLWAFLHHFCAGIRYLVIDLNIGSGLAASRASSKWVMAISLTLTVLLGVKLW